MKNIDNKCQTTHKEPKNIKYIGIIDPSQDIITIRSTTTGSPQENAKVIDTIKRGKHILDFIIPRGKDGTSFNILGYYDDINTLNNEHPEGNIADAYIVDKNLYIWSENTKSWQDVGKIKGPKGDKGDPGNNNIRAVYIVTFNDATTQYGIPVNSGEKLPLKRLELDTSKLITLDTQESTIKFNENGLYKISFIVSAYPLVETQDFDPATDIVAIGLREKDTDNIYIGASQFVYNGEPVQTTGQGIITITDTTKSYELSNISPKTIYLESPDIRNLKTVSYFSNSLITLTIEFLGKAN